MLDLLAFKATDVPAKNLIRNGDFSNGLSGWRNFFVTIENKDGYIDFIGSSTSLSRIQVNNALTGVGMKYITALIKSNDVGASIGNTTQVFVNHSGSGEWERLSIVNALTSFFPSLQDFREDKETPISAKQFMAINLTETFGVGNEPTKEQMDFILDNITNSWFDNTGNLFNAEVFMKLYFKEMNELKNAITSLGGSV